MNMLSDKSIPFNERVKATSVRRFFRKCYSVFSRHSRISAIRGSSYELSVGFLPQRITSKAEVTLNSPQLPIAVGRASGIKSSQLAWLPVRVARFADLLTSPRITKKEICSPLRVLHTSFFAQWVISILTHDYGYGSPRNSIPLYC